MTNGSFPRRRITALMAFEAASVAIASVLHLSGADSGPGAGAGIAEAIICAALVYGAVSLHRGHPWARTAALSVTGFAILGFALGLTITLHGGDGADAAYHAIMLPILILTATLLLRTDLRGPEPGGAH